MRGPQFVPCGGTCTNRSKARSASLSQVRILADLPVPPEVAERLGFVSLITQSSSLHAVPETLLQVSLAPGAACSNSGTLPSPRNRASGLVCGTSITPKSAGSFDGRTVKARRAQAGDGPTTAGQALSLVELPNRHSLIGAHSSGDDVCLMIVLSAHRRPGQAPQHRNLPDVRERIGYRSLEKLLSRFMQRLIRSQISFECFQSRKETPDFGAPGKRS